MAPSLGKTKHLLGGSGNQCSCHLLHNQQQLDSAAIWKAHGGISLEMTPFKDSIAPTVRIHGSGTKG